MGGHQIGYNRKATRWLGVWIDSRLSFRENTDRSAAKARRAEARLSSFMRRNGVPPLSARHLQEAIVGSTVMYGTEVTWKGQGFMRDSIQRTINRMSRASLGVLRSTPIPFLEAMGGSMPAEARLQACYAGRLAGSESAGIRDITTGDGDLARRLRASVLDDGVQSPARLDTIVERAYPPRGRRLPGLISIPPTTAGDEDRQERINKAVSFARDFETDGRTFWTDGSAFPGGVAAGAVVTYLEEQEESEEEEPYIPRVVVGRRGVVEHRQRDRSKGKRWKEKTYKESTRSFIRFRGEGGLVAEAWALEGGATTFDAELSALVRGVELCIPQAAPGVSFRIFTDSQAAMNRLLDDRPGPGQLMAVRGIIGATRIHQQGADISIYWVPGHAGVVGNEIADQWALDAATRELRSRSRLLSDVVRPTPSTSAMSISFLRATLRRRAVSSWRDEIVKRGTGRRPYRVPRVGEVPRIPAALRRARKGLASRFFQLASGHAMIAPFLKEKFGWVESDQCWWCSCGRQSREHLFKECRTWKDEIRELWRRVGEISGEGRNRTGKAGPGRRSKGFGFRAQEYRVGPGNCSVGRLSSDPLFTEAVLEFLEKTDVGKIKKGVVIRGEAVV